MGQISLVDAQVHLPYDRPPLSKAALQGETTALQFHDREHRFDIWLMLGFGVVGYVFKKIGIPLAPFTLALVLGNRAEDAFRLSMIGSGGDMKVFWANGLVGSITTLAIVLLFWPVIDKAFGSVGLLWRPAKA